MKAEVDEDLCTGCQLCTATCPEVFEMQGSVAVVKENPVPDGAEDSAQDAADQCPVDAINLE